MPQLRCFRAFACVGLALAANLVILVFTPPAAQARIFSQWVELGPDGASRDRKSVV
jgi:hypothetical protein